MASDIAPSTAPAAMERRPRRQSIHRHALVVRVTHWINLICMTVLLMSGLQIFNAHPALYWGDRSSFAKPLLAMGARRDAAGREIGVTTIFSHEIETTGILGLSRDEAGDLTARGFPSWATLPGPQWLAMGRRWHFFFAWIFVVNGLVYAIYSIAARHLTRDLVPSGRDLAHIPRSIWDHLRFRFPEGEAAKRYNVLQKLAYLIVAFGLGPLIVLAGLAMSPTLDAGFPWLPALFDGRQSARTVHFLCAFAFLGFVLIHLFMVLVSGLWNNLRSMITGRYVIDAAGGDDGRH